MSGTPVKPRGPSPRVPRFALFCALAIAAACSRPAPEPGFRPHGFLDDYTALEAGEADQVQRIYIRPDLDFGDYNRILIEPVTVWRAEGSSEDSIEPEILEELADYVLYAFHDHLKHDFRLVQKPGPGTMAIRLAITEASESPVRLTTASGPIPRLRIAAQHREVPAEAHDFLHRASIEMEIVDTITGERLVAAVDDRAGETLFQSGQGQWVHVESAFDHWANRMRTRLIEEGFGQNEE